MPTTLFSSADTGAPTIARTTGQLVTALDECTCLGRCFTEASSGGGAAGGGGFTDNSAEARLAAGTPFKAFGATQAIGDLLYVGGQQKFAFLALLFGTLGVGGTYAVEYYNGSAWVAIVSLSDGSTGLTANGTLSWAITDQTGWATVAINSITAFWVRIRVTATSSTAPQINSASIYGWSVAYTGTNGRTYRSVLSSGVQHYFTINDNGPGAAAGAEARIWGDTADPTLYNTAIQATSFPTSAQQATALFIRKSNASDTAKVWYILMDEKTVYVFIQSLDTANTYIAFGYGEFYSLTSGDAYRSFVAARGTENSATVTGSSGLNPLCTRTANNAAAFSSTGSKMYVARGYLGTGGSLLVALANGLPIVFITTGGGGIGTASTFNGPDNGILIGPVLVGEATGNLYRGRLRGLWDWGHVAAAANDGDLFGGTGSLSTKSFRELKSIAFFDSSSGAQNSGTLVLETSDTWEEN